MYQAELVRLIAFLLTWLDSRFIARQSEVLKEIQTTTKTDTTTWRSQRAVHMVAGEAELYMRVMWFVLLRRQACSYTMVHSRIVGQFEYFISDQTNFDLFRFWDTVGRPRWAWWILRTFALHFFLLSWNSSIVASNWGVLLTFSFAVVETLVWAFSNGKSPLMGNPTLSSSIRSTCPQFV